MYKKIVLFSALLSTLTQFASDLTPWFEIKPSYFFFSSCPMRNIYNHGGFEIQGSLSMPFRDYLDFYCSAGYRKTEGRALNSCEKTTLIVAPVDIGLKPIFNVRECLYYFITFGPRFFFFRQHNYSPYVDCTIHSSDVGFFLNSGLNVVLKDHMLLGVFGEYSYEKKTICPTECNVFSTGAVQIGGFAVGVSFGYVF